MLYAACLSRHRTRVTLTTLASAVIKALENKSGYLLRNLHYFLFTSWYSGDKRVSSEGEVIFEHNNSPTYLVHFERTVWTIQAVLVLAPYCFTHSSAAFELVRLQRSTLTPKAVAVGSSTTSRPAAAFCMVEGPEAMAMDLKERLQCHARRSKAGPLQMLTQLLKQARLESPLATSGE